MSRIQQILDKAEREGRMRRTSAVAETPGAPPAPRTIEPPKAHQFAMPPRVAGAQAVQRQPADTPQPPAVAAAPPPAPRSAVAIASPMVPPARPADARLNRVLVAALQPNSSVAEQYRALRTRIAQSENGRYYRALLVTSPTQGDGKSVTSLNLAVAMAQEFHRRVLLLDADLRNPGLHRLLGIPGRPGLSDVLLGTIALEEALVSIPSCRLTVLPAGSPVDRATELLGSAEMRRVVDTLRTQFDRIVFDTPPAAPLADVGVLAPIVDGVLLVVRAGRTQRPAIDRALEDLDPARVLGLILNDVEEPAAGYYYTDADAASNPGGAPTRRRRRGRAPA